ncbi:MAG: lipocalin family protein [Cyclobacteriaceae bacterium]
MKNTLKFAYLLFVLPFLFSCTEEEGGEGATADLTGTWTYESATFDVKVGDEDFITYLKRELSLPDAQAQEFQTSLETAANIFNGITLTFNSNGTYDAVFDGDSSNGKWALNDAGDKLTIDAGTEDESVMDVYTLSSSTFVFGVTETEIDDLNGDNIDETISINVRITLTK